MCQQDLYTAATMCAAAACCCNVTQAALQLDHLTVDGSLVLHSWCHTCEAGLSGMINSIVRCKLLQ